MNFMKLGFQVTVIGGRGKGIRIFFKLDKKFRGTPGGSGISSGEWDFCMVYLLENI